MFKSNVIEHLMRRRFIRNEQGSASIEAIIMIPVMFLMMLTFATLIDYTRQHSVHQKAAYTISDMISRETLPLDQQYLVGTENLLNALTRDPQQSGVLVTIVRYDANNDIFKLDWSRSSNGSGGYTNNQVRNWTDRLPMMVHNERMIIVETTARYQPPFQIGLGNQQIENFIFTRPRYAPQILWDDVEPDFAGS